MTVKPKQQFLQLYFKRAKSFLLNTEAGELAFNATISGNGPVPVPDWVKETLTYKHGVRDKSIIDLTPPTAKAGKPTDPGVSQYPAAQPEVGKNAAVIPEEQEPELVAAGPAFGNSQQAKPAKGRMESSGLIRPRGGK